MTAAGAEPQRVVLDTNVVLSALLFSGGGGAARLRQAWQSGRFTPVVSSATAQELVRVLGYPKFRLDRAAQEELLADYLPYTQTVRMPRRPPEVPACRDPSDMPFLELAAAGKASMLVSGDRALLALSGRTKFTILGLDAFVRELGQVP